MELLKTSSTSLSKIAQNMSTNSAEKLSTFIKILSNQNSLNYMVRTKLAYYEYCIEVVKNAILSRNLEIARNILLKYQLKYADYE